MAKSRRQSSSRGNDLEIRLCEAVTILQNQANPNARNLPKIQGVTKGLTFTRDQDTVLLEISRVLRETDFFFRKDHDLLMIQNGRVTTLQEGISLVRGAESVLANFFTCELIRTDKEGREESRCFPPPRKLAELLFCSEPVVHALPEIKLISQSPVYDQDFVLRGSGYHPEHGIYVLGETIDPIPFQVSDDVRTALDRLPPYHREWLSGFCFQSDADLVHCVAVLLTHLLIPHFIDPGKPVVIFDGNQPGLGKTLLVETMGIICDGMVPHFMLLTNNDEELQKQTLSQLRQERGRFLVFDNVKRSNGTAIVSPFLESLVTTSEVSIRILGKSEDYVCRNDRLIAITMNNTTASTDLISRSLPIRLSYEGAPRERSFQHSDLQEYVKTHRHAILGELYGMVEHWKQQGMPEGVDCHHRFHCWAHIVGGILQSCGFPEFLANWEQANSDFDETRSALEELLDNVIKIEGVALPESDATIHVPSSPLAASAWWQFMEQCDAFKNELGQKNSSLAQGRAVGKLVGRLLNQNFSFLHDDTELTARLVKTPMRSRACGYYFELRTQVVR